MYSYDIAGLACSLILLATSCIVDIKTQRIPNWLVLSGLVAAIGITLYCCICYGIWLTALIRVVLFVCIFLFGMTRLIGMGDIKLLMVLSLLNEPVLLLLSVALACAILVVFQLIAKGKTAKDKVYMGMIMVLTKRKMNIEKTADNTIPFAPYLLMGYVIVQLIVRMTL